MDRLQRGRRSGKIEAGTCGDWRVEEFEVSEDASKLDAMRSVFSGSGRFVPPGVYTRLVHANRGVVMSDTADELRDLWPLLNRAKGRVLINGLGLGCAVEIALATDGVEKIDVVEIERDVIDLVGPSFNDKRLSIHEGDAFSFPWDTKVRWDTVWHDVWDDLCTDNLSDEQHANPGTYAKLHRRFGRRCVWQGSWGFGILQDRRRRGM